MHIPLPVHKKEEFLFIVNYNIDETVPSQNVKKERFQCCSLTYGHLVDKPDSSVA